MTFQDAFTELLAAFDRLEIQYMVGGSAASSAYGIWRATGDIDFVARLTIDDVAALAAELKKTFYVDVDGAEAALRHQRAFNIIHFATSFKFDIFPLTNDRFQQEQFARRRFENASPFNIEQVEFALASPEDVILNKLRWAKDSRSEMQFNDVRNVMRVQGERLDRNYLRKWADQISVRQLLEELFSEVDEPR